MKNPMSFYKKLAKLIEKELPENCELAYDMGSCELYVIKKGAKFIEKSRGAGGTSWHGVLTPVTEPRSDEGYERKSVIGEGIRINLAAVQDSALANEG